jgi:uncharacterized protein YbjT (DUF2867 family)
VNVTDALAAINKPVQKAASAQRTVMVLGNVGDLGEKVLNRLLSSSAYSHVTVAARAPMRSAHAKLIVHPLDMAQRDAIQLPPGIQDVVCCISGKANFHKRDQAYIPLEPGDVVSVAAAARKAGVERFLLVSPMSSWLQMTAAQAASFGELELALLRCDLPSTLVLRPSQDDDGMAQGTLLARFAAGWLSILKGYLVPQSMQQLRSEVLARAAVHFLAAAEPGFKVISARDIHAWAHPGAGPRRGI